MYPSIVPPVCIFLTPGWTEDNVTPEFWSDILSVDTASYGDVVMGTSNMFCYGGVNRNHCGFEPHARVLRTLADAYHMAGFEIAPDPSGVRNHRTMEDTTGVVVSVVTGERQGVYSGESHIPFSQHAGGARYRDKMASHDTG